MPTIASTLVHKSLRIRPDDRVTVFFYPHSLDLAEDIAVECFKAGADVLLNAYTDRYYVEYMQRSSEEELRKPSAFCRGLTELSTAEFWIGTPYDPAVFRKIPPAKLAANEEGETIAHAPARERKVRSAYAALPQVTRPRAKAYGFSFARWLRMVQAASAVSPEKLAADGKRLAAALASGSELRVHDGKGTDLTMSLGGRRAIVQDGVVDDDDIASGAIDTGIPSGAVGIAPLETSANGTVRFTGPQPWAGRTIRRLEWRFEDGRVTSWSGDAVAARVRETWEKGTGDRDRIGGVTIGLNPKAELGFLQDELVRGAATIAIGANEGLGGSNKPGFYHAQTLGGATVELDGDVLVRNGRLIF